MLALRASNLKIKGLHKQKDSLFSLENTQHPTGLSSRQQERRVKLVTAAVGVWSASPSCALPPGTQRWARQRATDPDSSASALPAGAAAASTAPHRRKKWDWWWVLPLCPHFFPHPQLGLRPSLLGRASSRCSFPYRRYRFASDLSPTPTRSPGTSQELSSTLHRRSPVPPS